MQFLRGRLGLCLAAAMVWAGLDAATAAQQRIVIAGAGSNVPVYLYQAWTSKFNAANDHVQVRYMPLGTSESIRQLKAGVGDFGGGEVLLTDEQMRDSRIALTLPPSWWRLCQSITCQEILN